jgi:acetyl esterase
MSQPVDELQPLSDQLKIRSIEVRGAEGPLPARLYTSGDAGAKRDSLIVFFHAGGFVSGDLEDADMFLRYLTDSNPEHAVLAAGYTLATVRPFPGSGGRRPRGAAVGQEKQGQARLDGQASDGGRDRSRRQSGGGVRADVARPGRPGTGWPDPDHADARPGLTTCSMREMQQAPELLDVADACAAAYRGYLPNAADRTTRMRRRCSRAV